MLRLMLASHPNIGIPPEGGFVVTMGWLWGGSRLSPSDYPALVERFFAENNAQDWEISPEQLTEALHDRAPQTFGDFVDTVYRRYLQIRFPDKSRWGDKTTWYLDHLLLISEVIPNAVFVHLIRDGRDVACSYRNTEHLTHDIQKIALEWATSMETARRAASMFGPKRFLELHYEALTADPHRELERICRFLGEEFSDEMLTFHVHNREKGLEPERHMGWKGKTKKPADTQSIGRWRAELPEEAAAVFERIAGPALESRGYELTFPRGSIVERLGADIHVRAFGAYWRGRQSLRGPKARIKRQLRAART